MRVQLLKTLRGTEGEKPIDWIRGTIFDDSDEGTIPRDILRAVKTKSPSVLVLGDTLEISGTLEAELEDARSRIAELREEIDELRKELDAKPQSSFTATSGPKGNDDAKKETATGKFLCPVPGCKKEVNSERGLKAHLTQMHPGYRGQIAGSKLREELGTNSKTLHSERK